MYVIDEDVWSSIKYVLFHPHIHGRFGGSEPDEANLVNKKMIQNDNRCIRELRYGIPIYIPRSCKEE